MRIYFQKYLFLSFFLFLSTQSLKAASKLPQDKEETDKNRALRCKDLLAGAVRARLPSSAYMPVSEVIRSAKSRVLAELWLFGDLNEKRGVSPGLQQMYNTASSAAEAIIEALNLKDKVVTPDYNPADVLEGIARTQELMTSENPPQYIKRAVLYREGVLAVASLLERVQIRNPRSQKLEWVYKPVVAKGHQELELSDELSAVFMAWMLEGNNKKIVPEVTVYLLPMVAKSDAGKRRLKVTRVDIPTRAFLPQVIFIHNQFLQTVHGKDSVLLAEKNLKPLPDPDVSRTTAVEKSEWGPHIKEKLKEAYDLSMIPFPPNGKQKKALAAEGVANMRDLAAMNPKSDEFLQLTLKAGIPLRKLRYYYAHSLATVRGQPVLARQFVDPFENARTIVHTDFENAQTRGLRSGAYQFAVVVENNGKVSEPHIIDVGDLEFTAPKELGQKEIEETWANYLRYLKNHPAIKKDPNFIITTYSKHEFTLFEQEFEIEKAVIPPEIADAKSVEEAQKLHPFSLKEQKSPFYFEYMNDRGEQVACMIRNEEFFKRFTDVKPKDIASFFQHTVDLLVYFRHYIMLPWQSNSIKSVLNYTEAPEEMRYQNWANGLESIAWWARYAQTKDPTLLEKMRAYVSKDAMANYWVTRLVHQYAKKRPAREMIQSKNDEDRATQIAQPQMLLSRLKLLRDKYAVLLSITGTKRISEISERSLLVLHDALDRSDYLAATRETRHSEKLKDNEKKAQIQTLAFEYQAKRRLALLKWAESFNPKLVKEAWTPAFIAFVELSSAPNSAYVKSDINQLLIFEAVQEAFSKCRKKGEEARRADVQYKLQNATIYLLDEEKGFRVRGDNEQQAFIDRIIESFLVEESVNDGNLDSLFD